MTEVVWSFDVAVVPAGLTGDGRRKLDHQQWVRAVVAADRLIDAHLLAAQMVGCHGMVTDVLYRE